VLHGDFVSAAEGIAVDFPVGSAEVGMPVFVAIVYVGLTVVLEIFARSLDAVVESLAFEVSLIFAWRHSPGFLRDQPSRARGQSRQSDRESKCRVPQVHISSWCRKSVGRNPGEAVALLFSHLDADRVLVAVSAEAAGMFAAIPIKPGTGGMVAEWVCPSGNIGGFLGRFTR
jgi:hypothetical protein